MTIICFLTIIYLITIICLLTINNYLFPSSCLFHTQFLSEPWCRCQPGQECWERGTDPLKCQKKNQIMRQTWPRVLLWNSKSCSPSLGGALGVISAHLGFSLPKICCRFWQLQDFPWGQPQSDRNSTEFPWPLMIPPGTVPGLGSAAFFSSPLFLSSPSLFSSKVGRCFFQLISLHCSTLSKFYKNQHYWPASPDWTANCRAWSQHFAAGRHPLLTVKCCTNLLHLFFTAPGRFSALFMF